MRDESILSLGGSFIFEIGYYKFVMSDLFKTMEDFKDSIQFIKNNIKHETFI